MAFYKLKKDFKTNVFLNGKNDYLYWKIGSVIEGQPKDSNVTTNIDGTLPKVGIIGISTINIPIDFLEKSPETKKNLILGSESTGQIAPKNDKTFFTTKNIIIGSVLILGVLGILKWKKII